MYKLKIEMAGGFFGDSWRDADLGEEKPAINIQMNNLAELQDRNINYSGVMKLPKTKRNLEIFKRLDVFEIENSTPYFELNCRLFHNELELAGAGSKLHVLSIGEEIECVILFGGVELFELLKETNFEDIDLGDFIVGNFSTYPSWVKRAACLTKATELPTSGWVTLPIPPPTPYEDFIRLSTITSKIISHLGYSLFTNIEFADAGSHHISLASKNPSANSLDDFTGSGTSGKEGVTDSMTYLSVFLMPNISLLSNGGGTFSTFGNNRYMFTSNIKGRIKVKFRGQGKASVFASDGFGMKFQFFWGASVVGGEVYRVNLSSSTFYPDFPTSETELILDVDYNQSVHLYFGIQWSEINIPGISAENLVDCHGQFHVTELDAETIPEGGSLYINKNIGFETPFDLFKTFVQTYGMSVYVDNSMKRVYCFSMKKVYDNKAIAKDWTNKLSKEDRETSYIIEGYAQENTISFEKDKELEDKATFFVFNQTLEKKKSLFTMKWQAGEDKFSSWHNLAYLPIYTKEEGEDAVYTGSKPHLVAINSLSGTDYAEHVTCQYLINTYYNELVNKMLSDAKRIEAYFDLNSEDIETHDPFVPIYLSQYGAYFYIEKIINFIAGELTRVNLIKL